ncbi:hypothetical protein GCM10010238_65560 [Streptomyces griseoviridis]|uniref:Uncharacterized protein n=1 Tax=Streptomyces griseoviridis TaxID=45398 RepID=A0A918GVC1_STRGD|nr:hypothetical protein GCM10010238_65560 [Streptomyces niveoruber]
MTRQPGERLYAPTRQYLAIHASAELITGCARTERVLGWWSRVAREDGTARCAHGLRTAAGAVPGRLRAVAVPAAGWLDHGGGRRGTRARDCRPSAVHPSPVISPVRIGTGPPPGMPVSGRHRTVGGTPAGPTAGPSAAGYGDRTGGDGKRPSQGSWVGL